MFLCLKPNDSEPLYQQLARQLRHRLAAEHWRAGDQLPSARALSAELGLNFLTVTKVYGMLEQEGLLEMRRGQGTFVAARPAEVQRAARGELLDGLIDTLRAGARQLGVGDAELIRRMREKLKQDEP